MRKAFIWQIRMCSGADREETMEKKSKRQAQLAAASILVLVAVILALIFQFIHKTNARIT